jgi:HSP20 family protein
MANPQQGRSDRSSSTQPSSKEALTAEAAGTQGTNMQSSGGTQSSTGQQRTSEDGERGLSRRDQSALSAQPFGQSPFGRSPFGFMRRMIEDMDRMMDDFLGRAWSGGPQRAQEPRLALWTPEIELAQQGDELIVRADLPGLREEDIRVQALDDALVIEGERRTEREEERGNVFRSERVYGSFRRVIPLPEDADTENATASYENGVLEIRMKTPETRQSRSRQLEIKTTH